MEFQCELVLVVHINDSDKAAHAYCRRIAPKEAVRGRSEELEGLRIGADDGMASSSAMSTGNEEEREQQLRLGRPPAWVSECMSFAAAYPRLADSGTLRQSAAKVSREVLPLRPYMQPFRNVRHPKPAAILINCQLRQFSSSPALASRSLGIHCLLSRCAHIMLPNLRALRVL
jgi:hypothetical protein